MPRNDLTPSPLTGLILLLAALPAFAVQGTEPRILVTNDDGWQSPALAALVSELDRLGEVVVAAPSGNRSGSSQSLGPVGQPFEASRVDVAGAAEAWSIDNTPAGAAAFGLLHLGAKRPFDVLVSGINRGANVGNVAHYSGTVGAAMEAIYRGVPAIAVSQDGSSADYALAARYTGQLVERLLERGFPEGVVLSVNVPAAALEGDAEAVAAPMGGSFFEVAQVERIDEGEDAGLWRALPRLVDTAPPGTDTEAYLAGRITVTPLRFDWTDRDVLEGLGDWLPQPTLGGE